MARYSVVGTAAAGSGTLPIGGLMSGGATNSPIVREIKVFAEAANAARIRIARATAAPTFTALTEKKYNEDSAPPLAAGGKTATIAGTFDADGIDAGLVGAVIGSGFVYTYYGEGNGLWIPPGTANGIVLIEEVDTANTYTFVFVWDE